MLSTPPAFILSQDQTLMLKVDSRSGLLSLANYPKPSLLGFCSEFSQIQRSKPDLLFSEFSGFVYYSVFNFKGTTKLAFRNAEGGIWTLAPLLTTYSLSRGAPSTTWVLLLGWFINKYLFVRAVCFVCPKRREWDSNPRALSDKRFSRPPRYDRFDISPNVLFDYTR